MQKVSDQGELAPDMLVKVFGVLAMLETVSVCSARCALITHFYVQMAGEG